ncbi:MAG: hypothetical protein M1820_003252 [Bogoriella megaspora]|nr:MAG: hypothetical protein M1820_003252 [Bogoriella megaspora]
MASPTPILDLPREILDSTFSYLDATSFLALCSTCRAFHHPDIRLNATYWRRAVRSFRVPNQPAVEGDGARWQKLYRRLFTQTRAYTWGSNACGCLGHSCDSAEGLARRSGNSRIAIRVALRKNNISVPKEMDDASKQGVIADLQCSGWATTILTSQGILSSVGSLHQSGQVAPAFRDLRFPPGYPNPRERYDPATAIQSFSTGRHHCLGLSDSGRIWLWNNVNRAGKHIKFVHVDLLEGDYAQKYGDGRVKKVIAGWTKSSALIQGTGIVVWDAPESNNSSDPMTDPDEKLADTWLILENDIVPFTSYERPRKGSPNPTQRENPSDTTAVDMGEVIDYIMMEDYVVFLTHKGRVFASRGIWQEDFREMTSPLEIPIPNSTPVTALHGSFRTFALIANDDVLMATPDLNYLHTLFDNHNSELAPDDPLRPKLPAMKRYPCLQKCGVVSLAFGDWHWHALLRNGSILSGGVESQSCGSFGLGGHGDPEGRIRGLRYRPAPGHVGPSQRDGGLLKQCYAGLGRQIWFEKEKKKWVRFLTSGGRDPAEAAERMQICAVGTEAQGEVSEWMEQKGRHWEKWDSVKEHDDGLGPYFALSVAAGGWHSGALVLRNDDLIEKIKEACTVADVTDSEEMNENPLLDEQPDIPFEISAEEAAMNGLMSHISDLWESTSTFARYVIGLASGSNPSNIEAGSSKPIRDLNRFLDPVHHGASPGEGFRYIWADDAFPRLRLSSGQEMPGEIEFTDWEGGGLDWDLNFEA